MTEAQAAYCHKVAAEFKSRWVEDYDGEAYTVCEYMLALEEAEGGITLETPIDDAVRALDAFMSGPC